VPYEEYCHHTDSTPSALGYFWQYCDAAIWLWNSSLQVLLLPADGYRDDDDDDGENIRNAVHDLSHATSAKNHLIVLWLILIEKYYSNIERNLGRYVITYSVTCATCVFTWLTVGLWKGVGLRNTFVYGGVQPIRGVLTDYIFLGTYYIIRRRWRTVLTVSGPGKGQVVGHCEQNTWNFLIGWRNVKVLAVLGCCAA